VLWGTRAPDTRFIRELTPAMGGRPLVDEAFTL
jgi:hypothetical protein